MFSKSNPIPQRNGFSLTRDQIVEDIETMSRSEENSKKLFTCLDDKLPEERKFAEMETFIKGTQQLEDMKQMLNEQMKKLQSLGECLLRSVDEIEGKIETCSS